MFLAPLLSYLDQVLMCSGNFEGSTCHSVMLTQHGISMHKCSLCRIEMAVLGWGLLLCVSVLMKTMRLCPKCAIPHLSLSNLASKLLHLYHICCRTRPCRVDAHFVPVADTCLSPWFDAAGAFVPQMQGQFQVGTPLWTLSREGFGLCRSGAFTF